MDRGILGLNRTKKALLALIATVIVFGGVFAYLTRETPQNAPETIIEAVQPEPEAAKEPEDVLEPDVIVELINRYRVEEGLRPLQRDSRLDASAMAKCKDMVNKGYWSHYDPDGNAPWGFFTRAGVTYISAGENLSSMAEVDENKHVDGWYNSTSHKKNMLNSDFTHTGVAYCYLDPEWTRPGDSKFVVNHFIAK